MDIIWAGIYVHQPLDRGFPIEIQNHPTKKHERMLGTNGHALPPATFFPQILGRNRCLNGKAWILERARSVNCNWLPVTLPHVKPNCSATRIPRLSQKVSQAKGRDAWQMAGGKP